ncbi:ABC transporter ATP-binding protein [Salinarimonas soli]|uniref:sn-glycerol-3-phosphate ABC transporter ATP-binding protein UgpC n=1 Tax=Salinarimonas soli TaxID=1638099 RepID=A0A5B2V5P6_9HYPH|nr:sn-glycerol-3-phosphate ABC transporter ATP-binding protein UgpC [Salinarimonas soli]KAA2234853.1 sn-glycerol-3-phosphate ABC transporter ATP-binding protein UgpC [Salinarimonas soli]
MARLSLRNLVKRYGQTEAVRGIDLDVADGEFIVLVGPSGCGKSTTLRMIAGLESVTAGTLTIGDRVVNTVEPKDRDIAMVFQNYALYPHMSVYRNMAFGLRAAKRPADEIDRKVRQAAEMLGLTPLLERRPHELSGGQRQRVSMGRAIVRDPQVFLFDEPLSNLDAQLRGQVRTEIKRLHQAIGTTIVYVTHDQVEAMTLADRIVIMRDGRIEQVGTPLEVFHRPRTQFVASFIGTPTMNLIPIPVIRIDGQPALRLEAQVGASPLVIPVTGARAGALEGHAGVTVGLRPDDLRVLPASAATDQALQGSVVIAEPLGPTTQITVSSHGLDLVGMGDGHFLPKAGERVTLTFDPETLHFFGPDGARLGA